MKIPNKQQQTDQCSFGKTLETNYKAATTKQMTNPNQEKAVLKIVRNFKFSLHPLPDSFLRGAQQVRRKPLYFHSFMRAEGRVKVA